MTNQHQDLALSSQHSVPTILEKKSTGVIENKLVTGEVLIRLGADRLSLFFDVLDCLFRVVVDFEDGIQPRYFQSLFHFPMNGSQLQHPAHRFRGRPHADENTEPGAINKGDAAEVENDVGRAVKQPLDALAKQRGLLAADHTTADFDDRHVLLDVNRRRQILRRCT